MLYQAELAPPRPDQLTEVSIKFGTQPADNDLLVPAAIAAVQSLGLKGGKGLLFNGPASVPIAMALAHLVAHLYQFVACFDPKMGRFVVAISHSPDYRPGDIIA
jgi:CRISPR-associated protein Csx3